MEHKEDAFKSIYNKLVERERTECIAISKLVDIVKWAPDRKDLKELLLVLKENLHAILETERAFVDTYCQAPETRLYLLDLIESKKNILDDQNTKRR